jgi:hypothetical protein
MIWKLTRDDLARSAAPSAITRAADQAREGNSIVTPVQI